MKYGCTWTLFEWQDPISLLNFGLAYQNSHGIANYTEFLNHCRRRKCSVQVFWEKSWKCRKVVQHLPGEQNNPASSNHYSLVFCSQGLSAGFKSAALQPQSHLTNFKCRISLMAHFIFHVAPELAVAKSLPPISRFSAWLLILKVISNEELCRW